MIVAGRNTLHGHLGVLLGLATLIVAALRGVNILIVSLIAAGIVAVSNGRSWSELSPSITPGR